MSSSEPRKCQSCGMLIGPSGVCMACAETAKRNPVKLRSSAKKVTLGVVVSLGGLAGVALLAWMLDLGWETVKPPLSRTIEPAWRARTCKQDLQDALTRKFPRLDATVEKCEPSGESGVLCFVRALENGDYRTRPVEWNRKAMDLPFR